MKEKVMLGILAGVIIIFDLAGIFMIVYNKYFETDLMNYALVCIAVGVILLTVLNKILKKINK